MCVCQCDLGVIMKLIHVIARAAADGNNTLGMIMACWGYSERPAARFLLRALCSAFALMCISSSIAIAFAILLLNAS